MDLDDVIPNPQYQICHSRVARAPLPAVWDALHRVTMTALPLGHALEGVRVLPARFPRAHLAAALSPPSSVLRATPCRYLSRPQPGLAPAGRIGTVASGRGGPAGLVPTWMDQGRMEFRLEPVSAGTLLSTETRVLATDPKTRRAFAAYWFVIRPGSSAIRREVLKVVARRAESSFKAR